jgi:hypothetical protein
MEDSIHCLKEFPISHNHSYLHTKKTMEYLLTKEHLCVPKFANQCLRLACINSDLKLIKKILGKGANVNAFNGALLSYAVASNQMDVLSLLPEHGADPSLSEIMLKNGEVHFLPLLRKRGVDIDELIKAIPQKTVKTFNWEQFTTIMRDAGRVFNDDE